MKQRFLDHICNFKSACVCLRLCRSTSLPRFAQVWHPGVKLVVHRGSLTDSFMGGITALSAFSISNLGFLLCYKLLQPWTAPRSACQVPGRVCCSDTAAGLKAASSQQGKVGRGALAPGGGLVLGQRLSGWLALY